MIFGSSSSGIKIDEKALYQRGLVSSESARKIGWNKW
jgi:hypothetical protein